GVQVAGAVDATRRLDHRQQHSGQHVLSAAFVRTAKVATLSFHLGSAVSTIDLAREVTPAEIAAAEDAANAVILEHRPVTIRFVSGEEAAALPLGKEPKRTGELRIIEIADWDVSACGGTHVAHTGEIGPIAVRGWERFKGGTRLEFVCGGRPRASLPRRRAGGGGVGGVQGGGAPGVRRRRPDADRLPRAARGGDGGEPPAVGAAAR